MAINVNNQWVETEDILAQHDTEISDLKTEIEQLQEAVSRGGIATALEPTVERYARVNITKGAKGEYRHETTVTVTMTGGHWLDVKQQLFEGLRIADDAARAEIVQRLARDQDPGPYETDDPDLQPF